MSSEFTRDWPQEASLAEHARWIEKSFAHVKAHMQVPDDDRLQIAHGGLAIGGPEAAIMAKGMPGTGKTFFGNVVLGSQARVEVQFNDTEHTLFGHPNPINTQERIDGKFTGKLTAENPMVWANEISHVENTGPLHRLWDDKVLRINGVDIDMWNATVYATSNFPDGRRVYELDGAIRSRFGAEVLFGDGDTKFARTLHGRDSAVTQTDNSDATQGVLPNAAARANLREQVLRAYPLGGLEGREFGGYVTDMIEAINANPMLGSVGNMDGRLSSGWWQIARSRLLVNGAAEGTRIGAEDASHVAALVLPTVVTLSQKGKAELKTVLGVPKLDPFTEAVAQRRLLASIAYSTVEARKDFSEEGVQQRRDNFRSKYSYASVGGATDKIDEFVEKAVEKGNDGNTPPTQPARTRRRLFGRS